MTPLQKALEAAARGEVLDPATASLAKQDYAQLEQRVLASMSHEYQAILSALHSGELTEEECVKLLDKLAKGTFTFADLPIPQLEFPPIVDPFATPTGRQPSKLNKLFQYTRSLFK